MDRRRATVLLVVLAGFAASGLLPMSASRRQAEPTPLQLFQKMLPVVRHPRCINCHGVVNPITGLRHGGGRVDPDECDDCHGEAPGWHLPSGDHSFVGKNDEALCALFSDFAMNMGHAAFITRHIEGDEFIVAAFIGRKGQDPKVSGPPDPPPDSQPAFIRLAQDWLKRGQGACEVLGTIRLEESVATLDNFHIAPNVDNTVSQAGTRTVSVTVRGGKYYAEIKTDFTITNTAVQHLTDGLGRPCIVSMTFNEHHTGTTTGLASVAIKDTVLHGDTRPPQTDYRIDVTLPPETTQKTENHTVTNGCGMLLPALDDDNQSFDWDSTTFVIEGHVEDPKTEGRAGACDKMVKHGDLNSVRVNADASICNHFSGVGNSETPGLMERNTNLAFHDGSDIPFRVVVTWNLKFR